MHIIKIGDTLSATLKMTDEATNKPIIIDNNVTFVSNVTDSYNTVIGEVIIEKLNQVEFPGWVSLTVPSSVTHTWSPGNASLDVKMIINNDVVVSTDTIKFMINDSPTKLIGD